MSAPPVTATDRLIFALVVITLLHGFVILGVRFTDWQSEGSPAVQEVVLSLQPSEAPDNADFIAQSDQQGSGEDVESAPQTTQQTADFPAEEAEAVMPEPLMALARRSETRPPLVATTGSSSWSQPASDTVPVEGLPESPLDLTQFTTQDIASLQAMLAERQRSYAERPRVRTLTTVSAQGAVEADYILDWQEQVETIGNANYPRSARADRLSGDVRLLTRIRSDGTLLSVELLESSGHNVLDQSARTIIELAAPFPAFPAEMRDESDVLELIRTLRFEIDGRVRTRAQTAGEGS